MSYLDLAALDATPLVREPFDHLILPGFVPAHLAEVIGADYPAIDKAGSFALDDLPIKGAVEGLIDALNGPAFRAAVEAKFDLHLTALPTLFTLRGMCGPNDGQIHTDSKTKVITVLIYLNQAWAPDGGRLRLLRNGQDLEDVICEVPPDFGSLLIFRRSDNSWHGHKAFSGPRRVLQMNWVVSDRVAGWNHFRHRVSAAVKRLTPAGARG